MKKVYFLFMLLALATLSSCDYDNFKKEFISSEEEAKKNKDAVGCPYIDDSDCDSYPDDLDNCPYISNPNQEDTDGDGIGDACDCTNNPTNPNPPSGYVTAKIYLDHCLAVNSFTYDCGLARGITEVLNETKGLFANSIYTPVLTYYKIPDVPYLGDTVYSQMPVIILDETTKEYCETADDCYITFRSVESDMAMRQEYLPYLNGKLSYIDDLKIQLPQLSDYLDGYRDGCVQAYWFHQNSLQVFKLE